MLCPAFLTEFIYTLILGFLTGMCTIMWRNRCK